MNTEPFLIKAGDTEPDLTVTLAYDNGTPANLVAADVLFILRDPSLTSVLFQAPCVLTGDGTDGRVRYVWRPGDTDVPGDFYAEFQVTYQNGEIQTFPTGGYVPVQIIPQLDDAPLPQPAGWCLADAIEEVRSHLHASDMQLNTLAAAVGQADVVVTFQYDTSMVQPGKKITVGLETMYVWQVDPTVKQATVRRGFEGTKVTSHSADDVVRVNPTWTDGRIAATINTVLRELPQRGVFGVGTATLSGPGPWTVPAGRPLDLAYSAETGVFHPNTWQVSGGTLAVGETIPDGATLTYSFEQPLAPMIFLQDTFIDSGLAPTAVDLPALGAAVRLSASLPMGRADMSAQDDPRSEESVRTNDTINAPSLLRVLWAQRVADEASALRQRFPLRKKGAGL